MAAALTKRAATHCASREHQVLRQAGSGRLNPYGAFLGKRVRAAIATLMQLTGQSLRRSLLTHAA